MVDMKFDWIVALIDLGVIIGIVASIFGLNKKWPFVRLFSNEYRALVQ
jgi:hypothetical protein